MENIIRMTPGPTRYAISSVDEIESSFQFFLPESMEEIILDMRKPGGEACVWGHVESIGPGRPPSLHGSVDFLLEYISQTMRLDAESGRPIFRSTMSLHTHADDYSC